MKIIIEGTPKEIAALVVELRERQPERFAPSDSSSEAFALALPSGIVRSEEKIATGASSEDNQRSLCSDTSMNCV